MMTMRTLVAVLTNPVVYCERKGMLHCFEKFHVCLPRGLGLGVTYAGEPKPRHLQWLSLMISHRITISVATYIHSIVEDDCRNTKPSAKSAPSHTFDSAHEGTRQSSR
jgi:hypothetical protein